MWAYLHVSKASERKDRRVLVTGGRNYASKDAVWNRLDRTVRGGVVIEGGAKGADSLAAQWAADRSAAHQQFKADWKRYRRGAGPKRNQQMIDEGRPTMVLAFHNNLASSKGTIDMLKRARKAGVPFAAYDGKGMPYRRSAVEDAIADKRRKRVSKAASTLGGMDQYPSLYVPNGKGGHAHMKFKDKDARTRYMLDMQKRSNPGAHRKSLKRIEQHRAANGQEPLYSGRLSKAQGFDYGKYTGDEARSRGERTLIPDRMYQKYAAEADRKTKNQISSASIIGGAAGGVGGGFLGADQAKWHKNRGTKPRVNPKIAAPVAGAAIGASALGLLAGKNHMKTQRKLKEPAHRRRFDNAVIGAMTRLENAERFKAQRAPSGVAKADSGTWPQPVPAGSLSAMTTLAELGVIAKAQSKQQFHDPHESHGGRKMFAGGLAASGVGGALVNSGMKAAYRDNKYLTQDDAGQIFRRGSDGIKRPISSMQIKGAKRAIGGSTLGVLGGTALSAAPIVGGVNMWNKHKRRKAFNAQQAGGAA